MIFFEKKIMQPPKSFSSIILNIKKTVYINVSQSSVHYIQSGKSSKMQCTTLPPPAIFRVQENLSYFQYLYLIKFSQTPLLSNQCSFSNSAESVPPTSAPFQNSLYYCILLLSILGLNCIQFHFQLWLHIKIFVRVCPK